LTKDLSKAELTRGFQPGENSVQHAPGMAQIGGTAMRKPTQKCRTDELPKSTPSIERTESPEIEEALRASELVYRRLFETAKDGIFLLDSETGQITDANPYLVDLLGYSRQELVGKELWEVGPFKDIEASRSAFRELQEKEYIHYEDLPLKAKDGQQVEVEFVSNVYTAGEKRVIQCNIREISQRKRAEEAMRESEERYRELFENARDMICTLDLAGNFTSLNRMGEQVTGYTREEALRMNINQIVAPAYLDLVRQMAKGETLKLETAPCELQVVTRDHQRVLLEVSPRVLYRQEEPIGVEVTARDITERRRREDQLRQAQKMEAIGTLAGGVAHDFNNILTAILGYADLMLMRLKEGREVTPFELQQIKNAAERAAGLTQQLLAFSRKQMLHPVVLDINTVVVESMKMLRPVIGDRIELVLTLDSASGSVKADQRQMAKIIKDLVVNARDAMAQGGKLTIETARVNLEDDVAHPRAAALHGKAVMLAISDTGTGIDAEARAHIFEPFFTTQERGNGAGLGLSSVYGIVKQSGGDIQVTSKVGEGTTFRIYLPDVEGQVAEVRDASLADSTGGSETILVVDDEDMVRRLVCQTLKSKGYRVLEAEDGEKALLVCREYAAPIHLMLTDVTMPDMNGRELATRIVPNRRTTKVMYMSGYAEGAVVNNDILEPGLSFIQKPFAPGELARKVREVLGRSETAFVI
jgi:PAS domain S-box-containing protein